MNPDILVSISPNGEVTVTVNGVCGSACADLTKAIEQALGSATSDRKTPDYFKQREAHRAQR